MKLRLAGVDVAAGQLVLVREGDAVDEEVEPAPVALDLGEDGVHGRRVGDVAMADDRARRAPAPAARRASSARRPDR